MTQTIALAASGQRLKVLDAPAGLVAGSRGILRLRVEFDRTWAGFRCAADFGDDGAVGVRDGVAEVPDGAAARKAIRVQLVGQDGQGRMVRTNRVTVRQDG